MRSPGIFVDLARTSAEAADLLGQGQCHLILSDIARENYPK
jgi:hypothetical protein